MPKPRQEGCPWPENCPRWAGATAAASGAAVALKSSMNGISSAKDGREVPLVRGRVVTFPPARIAVPAARRTPQLVPGVVVPLDGWRYSRRRPGLFPKMEWFVVGSVATLLLLFFVRLFLR